MKTSCRILIVVGLLVAPRVHGEPSACPWAGVWNTNYGHLELSQPQASVYGDYTWDNGGLYGNLNGDGDILTGSWFEAPSFAGPRDAGDFQFIMDPDCLGFEGVWNYVEDDADFWRGEWNGTRVSELPPALVLRTTSGNMTVNGRPAPAGASTPVSGDAQIAGRGTLELRCRDAIAKRQLFLALYIASEADNQGEEFFEQILLEFLYEPGLMEELMQECIEFGSRRKFFIDDSLGFSVLGGRTRFTAMDDGPRLDVHTEFVSVFSPIASSFVVAHEPAVASRITAIDAPLSVDPAGAGPTRTLQPGFLFEADGSGLSGPFPDVIASEGFED